MGQAMRLATSTSFKKALDNSNTTLATDAPSTLRMTISRVRRSAVKAASPNKPKHESNTASPAKTAAVYGLIIRRQPRIAVGLGIAIQTKNGEQHQVFFF